MVIYNDQILVEMCIRDISQTGAALLQLRHENEVLNRIVANDVYLWNQVSQIARSENGDLGKENRHTLEEVVQIATQNISSAPTQRDEKIGSSDTI